MFQAVQQPSTMNSVLINAVLSSSPDYDMLFESLSWQMTHGRGRASGGADSFHRRARTTHRNRHYSVFSCESYIYQG
ncbi:Pre-mRNA-splicing ATP-dependent RNA helicase PRP28 [Dissostichus eleginoides]|uniref:Pre-mRNA-splicing ATP-dependent RNA helicase PRP28 n=1 Tax=Dissostichus eleginoides TaxID=100907 RepID=A0AAD9FNW6_DISEL|nr:Pre-mRNA-splicing ATP-dependent RNA helicase PRP28 [Dissostichus eleginoides]